MPEKDLAAVGIDREMEFAPGPLATLAILLAQPLAGAVHLQASLIDHDVNRSGPPGLRQRAGECQAGAAPEKVVWSGTPISKPSRVASERSRPSVCHHGQPKPRRSRCPVSIATSEVIPRPTAPTRAGRAPSRDRLGRDPDRQIPPPLQRPVVFRPVLDPVARPWDLVAARLIEPVGHQASSRRGSGPISRRRRPAQARERAFCTNAMLRRSGGASRRRSMGLQRRAARRRRQH